MRRSKLPNDAGPLIHRTLVGTLLLAIVVLASTAGCGSTKMVTVRTVPKSPLVDQLKLTASGGPQPSPRTTQFLRVNDLTDDLKGDPQELVKKAQDILREQPSAENAYVCAELAYLGAKKVEAADPQKAMDLYGASVLYSYRYLFDEKFTYLRNPYDPEFRGACDLYNGALEAMLRKLCKDETLVPGHTRRIKTADGECDITCVVRGSRWRSEDFGHFEFVSDYEMKGLKNHYQTYGLGVPLIAVRRGYDGEPAAAQYYPPGLSFPVTAFIRPIRDVYPADAQAAGGNPPSACRYRAMLELYDPLSTTDIAVDRVRVPLESDVTTPLAYFLSSPELNEIATTGLLNPESLQKLVPGQKKAIKGLWMVQPYEPGKIPVVFVHGLWSSPMTWMEMFNDLRSSPEIRNNYQFWFYLYPTGQPFWISAAQMRDDLAKVRQVVDPLRHEPALDQMVLIGHSMGGLVSRLQTLESGQDFWHIVSDKPFGEVKAEPEIRQGLEKVLFFHPNPSVRCVVAIGTPCRGSHFSNDATQWLLGRLISLPTMIAQSQEKLYRDNKDLFRDDKILKIRTSIDSLSPSSPVFPAMIEARRAPWVKYYGIVGLVPEQGIFGKLAAGSDGVVPYDSAHMDDVESELKVPADHSTVHSHPRAVLEVRRILKDHLDEMRGVIAYTPPVHTRVAATASATQR
jgi:pimeloyl-ACP methyl ester carboxylesterase